MQTSKLNRFRIWKMVVIYIAGYYEIIGYLCYSMSESDVCLFI